MDIYVFLCSDRINFYACDLIQQKKAYGFKHFQPVSKDLRSSHGSKSRLFICYKKKVVPVKEIYFPG